MTRNKSSRHDVFAFYRQSFTDRQRIYSSIDLIHVIKKNETKQKVQHHLQLVLYMNGVITMRSHYMKDDIIGARSLYFLSERTHCSCWGLYRGICKWNYIETNLQRNLRQSIWQPWIMAAKSYIHIYMMALNTKYPYKV